ncbi:hypothetical protein [Methanosarcina barkeri]|uniref:hypothetical protein n=1 Tax=Methanosarcina barkeri TaxID=2208 RepID=UPI000A55CF1C|nr:hypothetical protein [Methanosarcina barkeri]
MRNSKASGRRGIASIITVLCICFVLAALTGILSSDSIESFREEVTGYISSGPDSESRKVFIHLNRLYLLSRQHPHTPSGKANSPPS